MTDQPDATTDGYDWPDLPAYDPASDPFLNPDAPPSRLLDDVDPAWGLPLGHHDHPLNVEYRTMCDRIRRNAEGKD